METFASFRILSVVNAVIPPLARQRVAASTNIRLRTAGSSRLNLGPRFLFVSVIHVPHRL